MICLPCSFFLIELRKVSKKINVDIYFLGEERGPPMCQHIKSWYEFCLTQ